MKNFKFLFLSYCIIIILLALLPINGTSSYINNTYIIDIRLDYLIHSVLFIPFFFLLKHTWYMSLLWALLIGVLFSSSTEGVQYFLSYRAFNINDLLANLLGLLFGMLLLIPFISTRLAGIILFQKH